MSSRLRLTDALAMAGGVTDEADPIVYLIRRVPAKDGEGDGKPPSRPDGATLEATVPIDLEKLITGQDEMNLPLGSGDVVHVPKAGSVYVGGAVEKPGPIPLRGRMTVEQAVLAAGGPREVANWGDVRIYRRSGGDQREILEVDLNEIEAGKPGPQLQKDDVIIVGTHAAKAVFVGLRDFIKGIFNIGVGVSRGF